MRLGFHPSTSVDGGRRRGRVRQNRPLLRSGRGWRLRTPHGENRSSQPERDKATEQRGHAEHAAATRRRNCRERRRSEARKFIIAEAASGSIKLNVAVLSALTGITFDHQRGQINITGATISSDTLITEVIATSLAVL